MLLIGAELQKDSGLSSLNFCHYVISGFCCSCGLVPAVCSKSSTQWCWGEHVELGKEPNFSAHKAYAQPLNHLSGPLVRMICVRTAIWKVRSLMQQAFYVCSSWCSCHTSIDMIPHFLHNHSGIMLVYDGPKGKIIFWLLNSFLPFLIIPSPLPPAIAVSVYQVQCSVLRFQSQSEI